MATTTSSVTSQRDDKGGLLGWVYRHQLLAAYSIVFLATVGIIFPLLYFLRGALPYPLYLTLQLLTGWSPAIAAVVVSAIIGGKAEVKNLLGRFLILRVGLGWYLVALFLTAAVIAGGIGLHVLFGGAMPAIPAAASTSVWAVVMTFVVMVVMGFLLNTEEVLWRGFALPRLLPRYGFLLSCLLLAIPEVLLHLPNFLDPDAIFFRNVGIFWFSAFSIAAVIIYAWVFSKTKGSLFIVTLMHASQNAWSNLLSDNSLRPFQFTVGFMWLIAAAIIVYSIYNRRPDTARTDV